MTLEEQGWRLYEEFGTFKVMRWNMNRFCAVSKADETNGYAVSIAPQRKWKAIKRLPSPLNTIVDRIETDTYEELIIELKKRF